MKAYQIARFDGDPGSLAPTDRAVPQPGPGEVLVRIVARSLNYRDLRILEGLYPVPGKAGVVPLADGAGEVVEVGEGVRSLAVGDRVATVYFPRWRSGAFSLEHALDQFGCTRDGVLAEYLLAPEDGLIRYPAHLSFAEAACLPCAGVTAWAALNGPKPVRPGETVLTLGSGGVSLFALQFARLSGARTIAVTGSATKADELRALGVNDVIVRRPGVQWSLEARALTGGRGADHVVETGSLDTIEASFAAAAAGGMLTVVAALDPGELSSRIFASPVLARRIYVGSRAHFEAMNRTIAASGLRPVIGSQFAFDQAREAFGRLRKRDIFGKLVIADA